MRRSFQSCKSAAAVFTALVLLALSSRALEVIGYSPAVNDRFASGYSFAPVANGGGSFIGAGFDWSGVGWDPAQPTHGVTLITARHFVHATHQNVGPIGGQICFVNRAGVVKRYTIANDRTVYFSSPTGGQGAMSDLSLGTLAAAIPAEDQIAHYRISAPGATPASYRGLRIFVYGHVARIGENRIGDVAVDGGSSLISFPTEQLANGRARTESGDSGSPTFLLAGNELTLVGTHSDVGLDTFVPGLFDELAAMVAAEGQQLELTGAPPPNAPPVPSATPAPPAPAATPVPTPLPIATPAPTSVVPAPTIAPPPSGPLSPVLRIDAAYSVRIAGRAGCFAASWYGKRAMTSA